MNIETVRTRLRNECTNAGGVAPWAVQNGFSDRYIWLILNGSRTMSKAVLKRLGLEKVTTYRELNGK